MKFLKAVGRFLISIWFILPMVTLILSLCVWYFSPYIGTDAFRPFDEPFGRWTRYSYDAKGRCVKTVSTLADNPATATEASSLVVEHTYDPVGAPTWTRLETEKREGIEVSRKFIHEYNDGYDEVICLAQAATYTAPENLVTKVRYFTTGAFRGQPKSTTTPDGFNLQISNSTRARRTVR